VKVSLGFALHPTEDSRDPKGDSHARGIGYGVATVSRIDKIIGLFCKRDL